MSQFGSRGKAMQSGLDRPVAGARWVGVSRNCGRLSVLLLGFMLAACGNLGQIGNLNQLANLNLLSNSNEAPRVSVAFESVDGPPPAVHERFMRVLKDEAGSRRLAVVASADANYRLRGYLATHPERGATAISWAWDVYDSGQRRTFRLKGEDNAAGSAGWSNADDEVLRRIARSALDQFAGLTSGARQAAAASEPKTEPAQQAGPRRWPGSMTGRPKPPESSAFCAMTTIRPWKPPLCPSSRSPAPYRCRAAVRGPIAPRARRWPSRPPTEVSDRRSLKIRENTALVLPAAARPCYQDAAHATVHRRGIACQAPADGPPSTWC